MPLQCQCPMSNVINLLWGAPSSSGPKAISWFAYHVSTAPHDLHCEVSVITFLKETELDKRISFVVILFFFYFLDPHSSPDGGSNAPTS